MQETERSLWETLVPFFVRYLTKIAYLYVKSTKLLQVLQDVRQSGLIGMREDLDSNHSSKTERRESLPDRFLSF